MIHSLIVYSFWHFYLEENVDVTTVTLWWLLVVLVPLALEVRPVLRKVEQFAHYLPFPVGIFHMATADPNARTRSVLSIVSMIFVLAQFVGRLSRVCFSLSYGVSNHLIIAF